MGGGAHSLAPGQSSGVVGFDVALQLSEDGEVGLHPVGVSLVPGRREAQDEYEKEEVEEETQTPANKVHFFF